MGNGVLEKETVDADIIGGKRYLEDVRRSEMNGADPGRAEKMAFEAWGWRRRNFGNLASKGEALSTSLKACLRS